MLWKNHVFFRYRKYKLRFRYTRMKALACRAALRMNTMTPASGADSAQSIPTKIATGDKALGIGKRAIGPDVLRALRYFW